MFFDVPNSPIRAEHRSGVALAGLRPALAAALIVIFKLGGHSFVGGGNADHRDPPSGMVHAIR